MPTPRRRQWINGSAYALLVDRDQRGRATAVSLARKIDGLEILRVPVAGHRHQRHRVVALPRGARQELTELLSRLGRDHRSPAGARPVARRDWTLGLGLPPEVMSHYRPPRQDEPGQLVEAGRDRYGRPLWLTGAAANAWRRMALAAIGDGIALEAVSGFRSAAYQHALIARKRAGGQSWTAILAVSALPGYSEHHLGTVLDLHAGQGPVLEESFEGTDAFAWLQDHAGRFGFQLSYPRDNPHGIAYEPWHWRYRDPVGA